MGVVEERKHEYARGSLHVACLYVGVFLRVMWAWLCGGGASVCLRVPMPLCLRSAECLGGELRERERVPAC